MREIKFRAWDPERKVMEFVGAIDWEASEKIITCNTATAKHYVGGGEFELMQFTGLHDKNGKEIYSGDIMKDGQGRILVITDIDAGQVVMFEKEYGDFVCKFPVVIYEAVANNQTASFLESIEVIGNVWEHPELLKGDDNT